MMVVDILIFTGGKCSRTLFNRWAKFTCTHE